MRRGRVDSLTTLVICIILFTLTYVGMVLWETRKDLSDIIISTHTVNELTMQNRQLIYHLRKLNQAQDDYLLPQLKEGNDEFVDEAQKTTPKI